MKDSVKKKRMDVDSPSTTHFESSSHNSLLVQGLSLLRDKNLLFDVTLIASGEEFKAHRVVLASCSDYFRAMFTDAMIERTMPKICLDGISSEGLRYILGFIYTSTLHLSLSNVQDVLSAASHVQLISVIDICSEFLKSHIDLDNCVDIAIISETYSLHLLKKHVYKFMCLNFKQFCQTSRFIRLTSQQLQYILSCDYPVNCPETEVLLAVLNWIDDDKCNRISCGKFLLRHIRFDAIPKESMAIVLAANMFLEILTSSQDDRVLQLIENSKDKLLCEKSVSLLNPRGMELALLKVGGFSISTGMTNEITYFLPSIGKWRYLTSVPHIDQCEFGATVLNNKLYIVGGCFNQSLQEHVHPFGFVYNPMNDCWSTIAPMYEARCSFSLTAVNELVFAVGGIGENDADLNLWQDYAPCEVFNPAINRWKTISPLPGWRSGHASCSWQNFLIISGGLDNDHIALSSCFRYDISDNSWSTLRRMRCPRTDHVLLTYKDNIYVCGGWYTVFDEEDEPDTRILVSSIDRYDTIKDEWYFETFIPTPRYHVGVTLANGVIHIMGGSLRDATFDGRSGAIECYDIEAKEWFMMEKYPHELWEQSCCSLHVPTCRDDLDVVANVI